MAKDKPSPVEQARLARVKLWRQLDLIRDAVNDPRVLPRDKLAELVTQLHANLAHPLALGPRPKETKEDAEEDKEGK